MGRFSRGNVVVYVVKNISSPWHIPQEGSPLSCLEGRALSKHFGVLGVVYPCFTMGMIIFQMKSIAFQEWWSWSAILSVNTNVGWLSIFRAILWTSIKHILFFKTRTCIFLINQFITPGSYTFIFIKNSLSFMNMSIFNF